MMTEDYDLGYNDYLKSNKDGRQTMFETAELHPGDWYWEGVKAAHYNTEMETLKC